MFRSIMQRMDGNRRSGLELDPNVVARSFGAVATVGEPLPETDVPLVHAEDDGEIQLDQRAAKPALPTSLAEIAMARLQSLRPRTPERKQQIAETISAMAEPLQAIDDLVAEMEAERFAAIDKRWEEIRKQGRKLLDSIPALQRELAACMNRVNASASAKSNRRADLEAYFNERKKLSRFATEAEIRAANLKVAQAKEAARAAADDALADQQALATAEAALATGRANLQTHQTELSRLESELRGEAYFDPTLGLSMTPGFYRDTR